MGLYSFKVEKICSFNNCVQLASSNLAVTAGPHWVDLFFITTVLFQN